MTCTSTYNEEVEVDQISNTGLIRTAGSSVWIPNGGLRYGCFPILTGVRGGTAKEGFVVVVATDHSSIVSSNSAVKSRHQF